MTTIYDLPTPSPEALKRSAALSECIRQAILEQGAPISFAHYMTLALYHPQFGYYTAPTMSLGRTGDFTTAPEISPLFAQCLAKQFIEIANQLDEADIVELGAGSGRLAQDMLRALYQAECLPKHYYIIEISSSLREQQQALLKTSCPEFYDRIIWLDEPPMNFTGMIIANEVLDALPVHCFEIQSQRVMERCVDWQASSFTWQLAEPKYEKLAQEAERLQEQYELEDGYASEINFAMAPLIETLCDHLSKGIILFSDYGYGEREYYNPRRRQGSLTCFYQHHHHEQPFFYPGLQDITAHVNFTSVIEEAAKHGGTLAGYTHQSAFLLSLGLLDLAQEIENHCTTAEAVNLHHGIKLLTMPTEMGERVKIMAIGKDYSHPLLGFQHHDRSRDL